VLKFNLKSGNILTGKSHRRVGCEREEQERRHLGDDPDSADLIPTIFTATTPKS